MQSRCEACERDGRVEVVETEYGIETLCSRCIGGTKPNVRITVDHLTNRGASASD